MLIIEAIIGPSIAWLMHCTTLSRTTSYTLGWWLRITIKLHLTGKSRLISNYLLVITQRFLGFVAHFLLSCPGFIFIFIYIFLLFTSGKKSASPVHPDTATSRREQPDGPPNPNGFGASTVETPPTNVPAAASKDLHSLGSVGERWSDGEAVAESLLRTLRPREN